MKQKVYLETSVVSYYTSRPSRDLVTAARQQVTREWWEESRSHFETYISALVFEESKGGDPVAATKRLEAIAGMPILKLTDDAERLANELIKSGQIPVEYLEDALHIALATVNGMDFLLTWTVSAKFSPISCNPTEKWFYGSFFFTAAQRCIGMLKRISIISLATEILRFTRTVINCYQLKKKKKNHIQS